MDTSHTKQVLSQLTDGLNTGATTQAPAQPYQNSDTTHIPTQKKSYTEATYTTKRSLGSPGTHNLNKFDTKPIPSRRTDFGGLIVDFGDETAHHLPPDRIKDKLKDLFASQRRSGIAARIAEVRFSRKGNLLLKVVPAVATKDILVSDWTSATIGCLRDCLGLSETATQSTRIHPADP